MRSYTLHLLIAASLLVGCGDDDDSSPTTVTPGSGGSGGGGSNTDINATFNTATNLGSLFRGEAVSGSYAIDFVDDVDMYRVSLFQSGNLRIETSEDGSPTADTTLTLYNQQQIQVAYNDDGGTGRFSLINNLSVSAGTYYIKVEGWSSSTGNYRLIVTLPASMTTIPMLPDLPTSST